VLSGVVSGVSSSLSVVMGKQIMCDSDAGLRCSFSLLGKAGFKQLLDDVASLPCVGEGALVEKLQNVLTCEKFCWRQWPYGTSKRDIKHYWNVFKSEHPLQYMTHVVGVVDDGFVSSTTLNDDFLNRLTIKGVDAIFFVFGPLLMKRAVGGRVTKLLQSLLVNDQPLTVQTKKNLLNFYINDVFPSPNTRLHTMVMIFVSNCELGIAPTDAFMNDLKTSYERRNLSNVGINSGCLDVSLAKLSGLMSTCDTLEKHVQTALYQHSFIKLLRKQGIKAPVVSEW